MLPLRAADRSSRLARDAEAVRRCQLSKERRQSPDWLAGGVHEAPGYPVFARLKGQGGTPKYHPGSIFRSDDAARTQV